MNSNERAIIRGVQPSSEAYFKTIGNVVKFTDDAFIGGDSPAQFQQALMLFGTTGKRRDVGLREARTTDGTDCIQETALLNGYVNISDLFLQYGDGSRTEIIPIANVVLQYRPVPSEGRPVMQPQPQPQSTSSSSSSSSSSEQTELALCIGIPMTTIGTIEKLLSGAFSNEAGAFIFPTICESHNGYRWLLARCADPLTGMYTSGETKKIDNIHLLMATLKKNLLADIFVRMRFTRTILDTSRAAMARDEANEAWKLDMVLTFVHAIKGVDIGPASSVEGRGCEASQDVIQAVRGMKG